MLFLWSYPNRPKAADWDTWGWPVHPDMVLGYGIGTRQSRSMWDCWVAWEPTLLPKLSMFGLHSRPRVITTCINHAQKQINPAQTHDSWDLHMTLMLSLFATFIANNKGVWLARVEQARHSWLTKQSQSHICQCRINLLGVKHLGTGIWTCLGRQAVL